MARLFALPPRMVDRNVELKLREARARVVAATRQQMHVPQHLGFKRPTATRTVPCEAMHPLQLKHSSHHLSMY